MSNYKYKRTSNKSRLVIHKEWANRVVRHSNKRLNNRELHKSKLIEKLHNKLNIISNNSTNKLLSKQLIIHNNHIQILLILSNIAKLIITKEQLLNKIVIIINSNNQLGEILKQQLLVLLIVKILVSKEQVFLAKVIKVDLQIHNQINNNRTHLPNLIF